MPARQNVWELTEQLKRTLSNPTSACENELRGRLCEDKRAQHVVTNGPSSGAIINGCGETLLESEIRTNGVTSEKDLVAYNNYIDVANLIHAGCNIDEQPMILETETLAEKVTNNNETSPPERHAVEEGSPVVQISQTEQVTSSQLSVVQNCSPSSLTLESSESTQCAPIMTCASHENTKLVSATTKSPISNEERTSGKLTDVIVIDDSDDEDNEEVKIIGSEVADLWSKCDLIELDHVKIPCVYRDSVTYVALQMVNTKFLAKFVKAEELSEMRVEGYKMTHEEASVLNSVNTQSCNNEFGDHQYLPGDLLVKFLDFKAFYLRRKHYQSVCQSVCAKTGWYRVNDCTNTPYVERDGVRYVPLSVMRQAAKLLTQKDRVDSVQVTDGELLSLNRECLGIHTFGPSIKLVSVNIIQSHPNCKKIVELSENPYIKSLADGHVSSTAPSCVPLASANVKADDADVQVAAKLENQPVANENNISDTSISPVAVTITESHSPAGGACVPDVLSRPESSQKKSSTSVASITSPTSRRISSSTDASHLLRLLAAPPAFGQPIEKHSLEEPAMPLDLSCQYATIGEPSSASASHTSAMWVSTSDSQQKQELCPDVHLMHHQERHQQPYMPMLPPHSGSHTRQPFPVSQPFQRFPNNHMQTIHHYPSNNQLDQPPVPQRFHLPHTPQPLNPYHGHQVPFQPSLEDLQRLNPSIHLQEQHVACYNQATHQPYLMQSHPFPASLGSPAAVGHPRPEFHNKQPAWMQHSYQNTVNAYCGLPRLSYPEAHNRLSKHQSGSTRSSPTVPTQSQLMRVPPPPYPYPQQMLSSSDASRMQPHHVGKDVSCIRASPPVRFQTDICGHEYNIRRARNESVNIPVGSTAARRDHLTSGADQVMSPTHHPSIQSLAVGSVGLQQPLGFSEAMPTGGRYPVTKVSSAVERSAGTYIPPTSVPSSTRRSSSGKRRQGRDVVALPVSTPQALNGFADPPRAPVSTTGHSASTPAQSKDLVNGNELDETLPALLVVPDSNPAASMSRKFLPKDVKDNDIHVRVLDLFNRPVPVLHSLWRREKDWFICVEEVGITFFPHVGYTELEYTLHSILRIDCMRMTSMEEKALCNYYGIPEGLLRSKFLLPLNTFKVIFNNLHQIFGASALKELKEFLESRKLTEGAGATHHIKSGKHKATPPSKETALNNSNALLGGSRKRKPVQTQKVDVPSKFIKDVSNVISNLSTTEDAKLPEMPVSHTGQKENCSERSLECLRSPTLNNVSGNQPKKTKDLENHVHQVNNPLAVDLPEQAVKSSYDSVDEAGDQTCCHDASRETVGYVEDDDENSFCITISDVVSLRNDPKFVSSLESSSELHEAHLIVIEDQ